MQQITMDIERLLPDIRNRRQEIEQARRLPPDLAAQLRRTGVFALGVPRPLGGLEAAPADLMRVSEMVAQADGSTGWCTMVGVANGIIAGYMPEVGAREAFADPAAPAAGSGEQRMVANNGCLPKPCETTATTPADGQAGPLLPSGCEGSNEAGPGCTASGVERCLVQRRERLGGSCFLGIALPADFDPTALLGNLPASAIRCSYERPDRDFAMVALGEAGRGQLGPGEGPEDGLERALGGDHRPAVDDEVRQLRTSLISMAWAPSHRTRRPSSGSCSLPLTMVAKWLPASWPSLLLKSQAPYGTRISHSDRSPV